MTKRIFYSTSFKIEKNNIAIDNSELESKIDERAVELGKANKMKSIFLAQMLHEIHTPISTLVSKSNLLKYDFEENPYGD